MCIHTFQGQHTVLLPLSPYKPNCSVEREHTQIPHFAQGICSLKVIC